MDAKNATRLVVLENGAVASDKGPAYVGDPVAIGEHYYPFVAAAGVVVGTEVAAAAAASSGDEPPRRRLRGRRPAAGESPPRLAGFHIVGHAPHGVASLAPGQVELMLHRRAPVSQCVCVCVRGREVK